MDPVFETLFALIPPQYVEHVAAALYGLALVLAFVKWIVSKYVPLEWRVWTDGPLKLLDWLAANSKAMEHRPVKPTEKKK